MSECVIYIDVLLRTVHQNAPYTRFQDSDVNITLKKIRWGMNRRLRRLHQFHCKFYTLWSDHNMLQCITAECDRVEWLRFDSNTNIRTVVISSYYHHNHCKYQIMTSLILLDEHLGNRNMSAVAHHIVIWAVIIRLKKKWPPSELKTSDS